MDTERPRKAEELFYAATERSREERAAYLDSACAGDAALRGEVDSLLAADDEAGDFMEAPAVSPGASLGSTPTSAPLEIGEQIGAYRIVRTIASGGMGTVYEAVQDHPRRTVALKVIRSGIASPALLRRFEHEAQVLGALQHPGVAQIFEAGTADTGHGPQAFFAMELIEGKPLTDYATANNLGTRRRLELLARVCDAVEHAHQKGVIHRDLKPANILVDKSGQPKILDFGVARVTGTDVQVTTIRTDVGQLIGTIPYMSPEQIAGDLRAVDTRSDVYALGVILYELLSGSLPYDVTKTPLPRAAEIIREEAPRRLSSINRTLRGDIETITFKALEKQRERRYQSAGGFAQDIRRYLDNEPIAASPPSVAYQVRMFARRHKALVGALTSVILVLMAATLVSVTFAVWAKRERLVAQAAEAQAQLERKASEFQAYVANIVAAESALRVNDVKEARRRLAQTPPELRNWEWRHLVSRLDQSVHTFHAPGDHINAVTFSPDGTQLAGACEAMRGADHAVRVWDVVTGAQLAVMRGHTGALRAVAVSPDGKWIASGSADQTIALWDAVTGEQLATLRGHTAGVTCLAFSPDGTYLASGSSDETVRLWAASTGVELMTLSGHTAAVRSVAFSPDGSRLVSGARDDTAKLWDVTSGDQIADLRGHTGAVNAVAFSPDGRWIVTGSADKTLKLWDPTSGEENLTLRGHTSDVCGVAFSPAGDHIASASNDSTVRLWDVVNGQEHAVLRGHTHWVVSVAFDADGTRIASGSFDATVKLWDLTSVEDIPTLDGHTQLIRSVAFSPDGTRVASASFDETVKVWDVETRTVIATLRGHTDRVQCVTFSPDGARIATGSGDKTVRLWDTATGKEVAAFNGYAAPILDVAFSPDGACLVSGSADGSVMLRDASTGEEWATLRGHTGWVWSVAFSPDGQRLASASADQTIRLWDVATARGIATLEGHTSGVNSVTFSHDGTRLASASADATVRIWNAATGEEIATLHGHGGMVTDVTFNPEDSRLASASHDTTIKLWDPAVGEEVVTLRGHTHWVWCVAFSPDGRRLASGAGSYEHADCTVRLWEACRTGLDE